MQRSSPDPQLTSLSHALQRIAPSLRCLSIQIHFNMLKATQSITHMQTHRHPAHDPSSRSLRISPHAQPAKIIPLSDLSEKKTGFWNEFFLESLHLKHVHHYSGMPIGPSCFVSMHKIKGPHEVKRWWKTNGWKITGAHRSTLHLDLSERIYCRNRESIYMSLMHVNPSEDLCFT